MTFTLSSACNGAASKTARYSELIEREGFDVFITGDKNMEKQQRLEGRSFAVLVMSSINWPVVRPHVHKSPALDEARPGTVRHHPRGGWLDEWGRLKGGRPLRSGVALKRALTSRG